MEMEQKRSMDSPYDLHQYDRVWQRVAPTLEPYPEGKASGESLARLPGAEKNPCCMGSSAAEMLEVLSGFIEVELADQRYYQALSRQAPNCWKQKIRELAADEGEHARRLRAVYYLITGTCWENSICCDRIYIGRWCQALRERYHDESCGGLNYIRAAEGTTDPCLQRLLRELGEDELRHADTLLMILADSMAGRGC